MDLVEQHYAPRGAKDDDDDDEFYPYHLQCMLYNTSIFFFSLDNVTLHLDGVLYLRVTDPFKVCFFCWRQTCYIGRQL